MKVEVEKCIVLYFARVVRLQNEVAGGCLVLSLSARRRGLYSQSTQNLEEGYGSSCGVVHAPREHRSSISKGEFEVMCFELTHTRDHALGTQSQRDARLSLERSTLNRASIKKVQRRTFTDGLRREKSP